ncbi:unnamed protein product [Arabidopsis arenosa]|uniref:Uncharacterized protein n=1 Tax=Arabidopsis arenosa TaxID=38785 RepID=A0A8S2A8W7_ARAAE|nr:unnamed protein product [Arabidopsis arenosa]
MTSLQTTILVLGEGGSGAVYKEYKPFLVSSVSRKHICSLSTFLVSWRLKFLVTSEYVHIPIEVLHYLPLFKRKGSSDETDTMESVALIQVSGTGVHNYKALQVEAVLFYLTFSLANPGLLSSSQKREHRAHHFFRDCQGFSLVLLFLQHRRICKSGFKGGASDFSIGEPGGIVGASWPAFRYGRNEELPPRDASYNIAGW